MMKAAILAMVPVLALGAPRLVRQADLKDDPNVPLLLARGETRDLQVRVLNYAVPLDFTGWQVVLHGQTNGQAKAESYQVSGSPGLRDDPSAATNGWVYAAVDVDAWWPSWVDSGSWTMVATSTGGVRVVRAGGPLTVRGTSASDAQAPLPTGEAAAIRAELAEAVAPLVSTSQLAQAIAAIPEPDPEADPVALPVAQAAAAAVTNEAVLRAQGDAATLTNAVAQAASGAAGIYVPKSGGESVFGEGVSIGNLAGFPQSLGWYLTYDGVRGQYLDDVLFTWSYGARGASGNSDGGWSFDPVSRKIRFAGAEWSFEREEGEYEVASVEDLNARLPTWPSIDIATNIVWNVVVSNGHWLVYGTEVTP